MQDGSATQSPGTSQVPPLQVPALNLQRAEAIAASSAALLQPLVDRLAEAEQTIRQQAEELGTLRAKLAAREQPRRPWWQFW